MPDITIHHDPASRTSRKVLAMISASGVEPTVIEYLKTPPSTEPIKAWLAAMGATKEDGAVVINTKGLRV